MIFTGYIASFIRYDQEAHKYVDHDPSRIYLLDFTARAESPEAAAAFVTTLPKSLKVKAWKGSPMISFRVKFHETKVTGDANETGMRRVRRFLELCEVDAEAIDHANIANPSTLADLRKFVGAA